MREDTPLVGRQKILARAVGLLDDASGGVVFVGEAGIGKTRVAHEVVRVASARGFATMETVATQASAAIPLGALSHLLPDLRSVTGNMLAEARRAIEGLAGGRPLLLSVDDAHLLDDYSASLLLQLAMSVRAFVVATLRSGEPPPDAVVALWKDGFAERIEVDRLEPAAIAALVDEVLGGRSDGGLHRIVVERSAGNPLIARELCFMGRDTGAIAASGGTWTLAGELRPSPRLVEIVSGRFLGLSPEERSALELIAYGEPIGQQIARKVAGAEPLLGLERAGLAHLRMSGRRRELWLSHPVYGEVVRTASGPMLEASMKETLAEAVAATGMRRRTDQMQVATWQLDAGTADPGLLTAAAGAAYRAGDMASTARLAAGAWDRAPSGAVGLLLGTSLAFSGRYAEADAVFSVARDVVEDEPTRVRLARAHATVLANAMGRPGEAMSLLTELERRASDPAIADALRAQQAQLHALAGRVDAALAIAEPLLTGRTATPTFVAVARTATIAYRLAGSYETLIELAERTVPQAEGMWATGATSVPPEALRLEANGARVAMGHLDALPADAPTTAFALGRVVDRPVVMLAALHTAVADLLRGRPVSAASRLEAVAPVEEGFVGPTFALVATCLALTGRTTDSRDALRRAEARDAQGEMFNQSADEARAWVLIAEGQPAEARTTLASATAAAVAAGQFGLALSLAHLLARIGGATDAAALAAAIPPTVPGPLPAARRQHIEALGLGDAAGLEAMARIFADMGANLLAAEAATQAARAFRRGQEPRRAARLLRYGAELAARCEGALTPGLQIAPDELAPLSDRELEIATLAVTGISSAEIANRLVLSTRTVDNHLQHIYQKLGVSSRAELRTAIPSGSRDRDLRESARDQQ
jgi:DNA-binding CsgD family transcriptional regulator/tetratricopeptide (TPR) repeat protein